MEKKILGVVLAALLFLTSCERADLPNQFTESTLVIHKNGRLTEYLVEEFDQSRYDLDELRRFAEEEVLRFGTNHGNRPKNVVRLERVERLESGKALVVFEYPGKSVYAEFNGCTIEDIVGNRLSIKIMQEK